MHVYLFRHGQKDSASFSDPDLTSFGHSQAKKLSEMIKGGDLLRGTHFLASPRIRAQSTLRPSASLCESPLQIVNDLDQRGPMETGEAFRVRIEHLISGLEKKFSDKDVVYLCSHHDWIEESLSVIPADTDLLESRYWSWNPTQYMHFEVIEGLWYLRHFDRIIV